jgi:hypothetical protein
MTITFLILLLITSTALTERPPLVGEVTANFCGYRGVVVSAADLYVFNLGILDRSRYFFFQVGP